jgi:VanZ family protein
MRSRLHRSLSNPRLWQAALVCYWLALFIVTHIPIERLALHRGSADKFAHVGAFAVLSMLLACTWRLSTGRLHLRQLVWVWLIVVLYGAIEETTQPMVNRVASSFDWLADAVGATLGLTVFWLWSDRWLNNLAPELYVTSAGERPRTWHRYSLRTLFVVMTLGALACYWMMLPTMNAQRFVRAIQQHDYATAESLFMASSKKFPGDFKNFPVVELEPSLQPLTWSELWKGERAIFVTISFGNTKAATTTGVAGVFAYRRGLAMHPLVLSVPKPLVDS